MNKWKVWKLEHNYRSLFWASVINGIGNRFTQVAVLTLLYQLTESALAIGFLFVIRMVPYFFISPFGGFLADALSKKQLLIITDLIRVPFALLPVFVQGPEHIWLVYVSAFCIAAGEAVYAPTRMASIPSIVKRDRLLYINSIEQIMVGMVLVIGSSAGGIMAFLFGLSTMFILDAVSFLFSAFILIRITFPTFTLSRRIKGKKQPIHKLILISGVLLSLVIIEFTMPLANGIDNVLMSIYALDVFHMGEIGVGIIYACLGIGFILSSFFSKMLKDNLVFIMIVGICLEGIGHMLLGTAPTFFTASLTVLFITFVGGISNICLNTLTMKIVPKTRQGSFFGLTVMISNTFLGLSMGVAGFLVNLYGPRKLSLYVGITYILFTILYAALFSRLDLKAEKRKLNRQMN